jgi:gamma-glutamylcyclotransferase (GGCT)/AIG2-like uncharacterized protein YtfP
MSAVRLFVYGSLRRDAEGRPHPLLADAIHLGAATVPGALYRVDWYPGLVLGGDGTVHGELYELPVDKVDHLLGALDDYEGGGFRRRKATVHTDGVAHADAWVYAYIGPTHALQAIAGGDYGPPVHRARA